MKKIFLILSWILLTTNTAYADDLYHGIDIDKIYNNGDWSSKKQIKQVIDDYGLFLNLQEQFKNCPNELPDSINCYDNINKNILQNFYTDFSIHWTDYLNFKKATEKACMIPFCSDKFSGRGGSMCYIDGQLCTTKIIKNYVQTLFEAIKNIFSTNYTFTQDYKIQQLVSKKLMFQFSAYKLL